MPKSRGYAVCLLSGGLDSAVAMAIARAEGFTCHCLSFDYEQRHRAELDAAIRVARHQQAESHRIAHVDLRIFGNSALTDDIAVPKTGDKAGIPVTYVPARNTVFLSFALALAEVTDSADIFIGVNAIDYSGYPDCRPEYVAAYERMANLATKAAVEGRLNMQIHTPLIRMTKADIVRRGTELGVDFALTHSCYDPVYQGGRVLACGLCDSCRLRLAGFAQAGLTDPIPYAC